MRELLSFPDPVDELAARTVAAGVAVLAALALVFVPGPPRRFAQSIGLVLTTLAAVTAYAGVAGWPSGLAAVLLVVALLESVLGSWAGCWVFGRLMRFGIIPRDVCEECADVGRHHTPTRVRADEDRRRSHRSLTHTGRRASVWTTGR